MSATPAPIPPSKADDQGCYYVPFAGGIAEAWHDFAREMKSKSNNDKKPFDPTHYGDKRLSQELVDLYVKISRRGHHKDDLPDIDASSLCPETWATFFSSACVPDKCPKNSKLKNRETSAVKERAFRLAQTKPTEFKSHFKVDTGNESRGIMQPSIVTSQWLGLALIFGSPWNLVQSPTDYDTSANEATNRSNGIEISLEDVTEAWSGFEATIGRLGMLSRIDPNDTADKETLANIQNIYRSQLGEQAREPTVSAASLRDWLETTLLTNRSTEQRMEQRMVHKFAARMALTNPKSFNDRGRVMLACYRHLILLCFGSVYTNSSEVHGTSCK